MVGGAGQDSAHLFVGGQIASVTVGGTQQYIFFGTGSDLLPSNGVSQAYQLIGFLDNGGLGVESFTYSLTAVNNSTANEEKVTAFPAVAGHVSVSQRSTASATRKWPYGFRCLSTMP